VIECSAGTYVRSLIADLGDAYCTELRRTRIGAFDVADADEERIVPLDDALAFLPALQLDGDDARRASHGVAVPGDASGTVRLRDADGLIALGEPREPGLIKPVVGFRG
jgi:tRNA pseudouridine55 synthase